MILRLYPGNEIVASIIDFCNKNNIDSAQISAIGAISKVELAMFLLDEKKYIQKELNEPLEIVNLSGNIGTLDGKIVSHLHIAVANTDFAVFGGHLNSAFVAATCEVIITPLDEKIIRKYDDQIGLNLIDNG